MSDKQLLQLDLNLLKVFETLFLEQNMSRTAEVLFITPSAVSHAMRRLREALQDPLFERQGNQMKPTSACIRIAPQIMENLNSLRKSLQQFTAFDPDKSEQQFTIAIHDALESLYIPPLHQKISTISETLSLSCVQMERGQLQRQLSAGQADLAIDVALPMQSPINHQRISDDNFLVLHRKSHEHEAIRLTRKAYLNGKHLTVSNRPSGRVVEDINLQQQSINRKIAMRCQNYQTAKAILKQSDLFLTAPELIARSLLDEDLHIQPLPINVPNIEIHLYWHENTEHDGAINWLKQQIISL